MKFSNNQHSFLGTFLLSGGILALFLAVAGAAQAQSIAVHWESYYAGQGAPPSPVPAGTADGIQLPDGTYNTNWTNIQSGWYGVGSGNNTNLQDSNSATTTVAVGSTATNGGSYWYDGGYTSADPLLNGPWGGNGPIPNVITGITYSSYEIIGYVNPPYGYGTDTVWVDSNPAASNSQNAPLANSQYYFSPDSGNGAGIGVGGNFVLMTNNTSNTSFPAGNTVVWTNLSGTAQTLWTTGTGPNPSGNNGFAGFEIVNTSLVGIVWSGSNSSDWNTAANWAGGALPTSGGTVSFGSASANPSVDLGASNQTLGEIVFSSNVNTTISSSAGNTLFLDNTANSAPANVTVFGGSHAITSAVALNSNTTITVKAGQLTVGANVSNGGNGSAGITVGAGVGTLVLAGSNTYSGSTNITGATTNVTGTLGNTPVNVSAGVLSLQNAGAVSQNTITVSGGALNQTVANAISGTTVLALSGGVTTLSQSNSYSGGTTVASGATLLATNAGGSATGTNGVAVNSGGTLGGSGFIGSTVTVNAGGMIAPSANTNNFHTLNLANLSVPSGGSFNFNIGASSNDQVLVSGNLNLGGAVTFNVAFPAGLAAGTFQLMNSGSGTYSDTSTINVVGTPAETYTVLTPGSSGNSTGFYEVQTTILTATWSGSASTAWDTTSANWTGPSGSQYVSGQPVIFPDLASSSSSVTIASSVSPNSVTFSNNATTYTLSGAAGIGGIGTLALTGTGTVVLANSNSYTGGTTIGTGATLQIGAGGLTGALNAASAISNSGTLVISRSDNYNADWHTFTGAPAGFTLANTISGPGGVTLTGGGFFALSSSANSFQGQIYVQNGVLQIANPGQLGSATTIVIGDTSGGTGEVAGIYFKDGQPATVFTQNVHVLAGNNAVAFIAGATAGGSGNATYSGSIQIDKTTNLLPGGYWGNAYYSGAISGSGGINLFPQYSGTTYLVNTSETFQGNVSIGSDNTHFGPPHTNGVANNSIYWDYNPATNAAVNTSLGQGTITVQNNMGLDFFVNAPAGAGINTATMTNPINVLSTGGVLYGDTANSNMAVAFSGPVSLAGQLVIGVGQNATAEPLNYGGQVTLDRSAADQPGFLLTKNGNGNYGWAMGSVSISGNIVDGSGSYRNPLYLATNYFTSPQASFILYITGSANSYTTGTVVASGVSNVLASSSLGTGQAVIEPSAVLRLNAASSVPGGVLVTSNGAGNGILSLAADFDPAGILNPVSKGLLAVDTTVSAALNLANEGNGMMSLGSWSGGTYSATSLGANSDGNYHLGGGGGLLTLTAGNLLTGANSLIVGQVGGILPAGNTAYGVGNGGGTVKFNANQAITGPVMINGGTLPIGGSDSTLELVVQSSGQPLGSGANDVNLQGGTLQFDMPASGSPRTDITIGNLIVNGGPSTLAAGNANTGSALTIAGTNGIVRNYNAALFINSPTSNNGNTLDFGANGMKFLVANNSAGVVTNSNTVIGNANSGNGSNGMVTYGGNPAPWITFYTGNAGGNFLAYDATNGFVPTTYTVGGVVGQITGGTSTLALTNSTDIVAFNVSGTDTSLTADTTIYALKTIKASGTAGISTTLSTPINLIITSGGLSADEQNGSLTIGGSSATAATGQVNVVFGSLATPTEAVIWSSQYNGTGQVYLNNGVIASSLTKFGPGNLQLYGTGTNSIPGPVTINSGIVLTGNNTNSNGEFALGPGTGSNYVVLNGGEWQVNYDIAASITHNIQMGPAGGIFGLGNQSKSYAGSISDVSGLPAGVSAGPLTILVGNNSLTLTNTSPSANQWSGGTIVKGNSTNNQVVVQPGVNFGTGDVTVASATLVLGGSNLSTSANLSVAQGASVIFQSTGTTPVIGSLAGLGSVVLGNSGAAVTLTVGGNNASTYFAGTISENAAGVGAGLTKTGSGMMTLAGADSYTGPTTVNAGTLKAATQGAIPTVSAVSVTGGVLDVTAAPVTVGSISIGSLGGLNLALGNVLNSSGAATFNSGTLNLSGSVGTLPELLMTYLGSATGTFSNLTLNGTTLLSGDLTYLAGSLELTSTAVPYFGPTVWQGSLSTSWTDSANWYTATVPNAAGVRALVGSATTAPTTITLDGAQTVGQLTLSATSAASGYTLAAGNGGSLTMSSGSVGVPAQILITSGSHTISAPVSLTGALSIVPTAGTTLSIPGNISEQSLGAGSLSLDGPGTLVLGGSNSYTGGTSVTAAGATLIITAGNSIAPKTNLTVDAGGTFLFDPNGTADLVATTSVSPAGAIAAVPEPGTLALMAAGLVMGFGIWRRKKGI